MHTTTLVCRQRRVPWVPRRWQRLQSQLLELYLARVRRPARLWVAAGRPREFMPRIPWWHQLLFSWLVYSGRLAAPPPRRSRRARW